MMATNRSLTPMLATLLVLGFAVSAPALVLGHEQAVSSPVRRPGSGVAVPQVPLATDGATFFTAWVANRNGLNAVYGTRLGSDGAVLDPGGVVLAPTDASFGTTAVVPAGRDFVVFAPESRGLVVARVRDGVRINAPRHVPELGVFLVNSAASNGAHYVLVVREKNAAGTVIAKVLVLDLDFAVEQSLALNDASSATAGVALVNDGSEFVLVYENYSGPADAVYVQRLDSSGTPTGERRTVPTGSAAGSAFLGRFWPAITANGNGFTIVWMAGGVRGVTMSSAGVFGQPFRITAEEASFPSIAWNGREQLVTWTHVAVAAYGTFQLDGARIDASGDIVPTGMLSASSLGQAPAALAGVPAGFFGIWFGNVFGDGARDSLTSRFFDQNGPLLAAGSTNVLAAWGEGGGIYAGRLAPDGTPLDGGGIQLAPPEADQALAPMAIASNGRVSLVAWRRSDGQLAISRISEAGGVLDPSGGTLLTVPLVNVVAASDGVDFLLVWSSEGTLASLRIPAEGMIPSAPQTGVVAHSYDAPVALRWNGVTYSLLWQQQLEGDSSEQQRLSPLDRDGRILGTAVIGVNLTIAGIEPTGNELLVAYTSGARTYTQRFSRAGDPASERVPIVDGTVQATLTRSRDGFALFYENGTAIDARLLDVHGNPQGSSTIFRKPDAQLSHAIFALGTTWLAYTAPQFIAQAKASPRRVFTGQLENVDSPGRRRAAP